MDTLRNPMGPHSPGTYWRRRLVVVAVLLTVVGLVSWSCARNSGAGQQDNLAGAGQTPSSLPTVPAETPTPTPTPTPSATGTTPSDGPSGSASTTGHAKKKRKPKPSPSVSKRHGKRLCDPDNLRVTVRTDQRYYSAKERPKFTLIVVNIAKSPCYVDVGSAETRLNVISGKDHVWSTADCASGKEKLRKFSSGGVYTRSVTWKKVRSWKGCPDRHTTAKSGYYVLDAKVMKATPKDRAVFVLKK